ncbi:MAG: hypothetical protein ACW9W4_02430 [Candidatus Nitrosopumilus sp. bin_7KS]
MYTKIAGFALMSVLAMMVIPSSLGTSQSEHTFYGAATMIQKNAAGQEIFSQTIHNRIVDTGEEFLLDQTFQDSVTVADNIQIGSICISDAASPTIAEAETAADFDGDNGMTENNCKEDTTVTTSSGTAVIGSLQFTCGGTNCADNDTITAIGICQNDADDDGDFNDCATEGILFAVVDVTDTQLATSETVDITYTFDISSSGN